MPRRVCVRDTKVTVRHGCLPMVLEFPAEVGCARKHRYFQRCLSLRRDGLWKVSQQSAVPLGRNPAQPQKDVPATAGLRLGSFQQRQQRVLLVDWRVLRPIKFGDRFASVPMSEMFNTFNNRNNVNPLITPGLFNFDGFLRQGVGGPRQVQLAVKFTF
jgi:hypothetical protein